MTANTAHPSGLAVDGIKPTPEVGDNPQAHRRQLPRRWRHLILIVHIVASVAILGDSAGFLAIAIRARGLPPEGAHTSYEILGMLSVALGIPMSMIALVTGVMLGLGTRWGVFRHPWVIIKLALLASIMAVGGLVLSPAESAALDGAGGNTMLIVGAAWDVAAVGAATALSVIKPGRALRRRKGTRRRNADLKNTLTSNT